MTNVLLESGSRGALHSIAPHVHGLVPVLVAAGNPTFARNAAKRGSAR